MLTTSSSRPPAVRVFGIDATRTRCGSGGHRYVPQALSADANLTGVENVELFARLFDVPRRQRRDRVRDALEAMGLTEAAGGLAGTYSGGMVRRLETGPVPDQAPRLLVLDEPTVGLDPIARGVSGVHRRLVGTSNDGADDTTT